MILYGRRRFSCVADVDEHQVRDRLGQSLCVQFSRRSPSTQKGLPQNDSPSRWKLHGAPAGCDRTTQPILIDRRKDENSRVI
jgi:hypothetical protein